MTTYFYLLKALPSFGLGKAEKAFKLIITAR